MRKIKLIVIHCSDSNYERQTAAWIDKIHREERGFDSIGYHFFIRLNGLVEVGRPIDEPGAHAYGYNKWSIGICLAGKIPPTKLQEASLDLLLVLLSKNPDVRGATIAPHNKLNAEKTCPNFDVSGLQDRWAGVL